MLRPGFFALAALAACGEFVPTYTEVAPGVLAVTTAPGATIEVLDWGGSGKPIVFLAGGGHTAHEFDEFAPRLTDRFRVIGITRRGIGASANAQHRTQRDKITDIARVLDTLNLPSAVLIGHSQGGLEAAQFAMAFPERCLGVVHLDSGYLGGNAAVAEVLRANPAPNGPEGARADSASTAATRAWIERMQGFRLPESEIRAVNRLDSSGRIVGRAPRNTGAKYDWYGKLPSYRWDAVRCPSLGLYAVTAPLQTWLPWYAARYGSLSTQERQQAARYVEAFGKWTAEQRTEFGRLARNRVVKFRASGHYFFLEHPEQDKALSAIRDFATGLP